MVYLVYGTKDKTIYMNGVYKSIKDAENVKKMLIDTETGIKYELVDVPYWAALKSEVMHYSEEDNDIEEEDYYKVLRRETQISGRD